MGFFFTLGVVNSCDRKTKCIIRSCFEIKYYIETANGNKKPAASRHQIEEDDCLVLFSVFAHYNHFCTQTSCMVVCVWVSISIQCKSALKHLTKWNYSPCNKSTLVRWLKRVKSKRIQKEKKKMKYYAYKIQFCLKYLNTKTQWIPPNGIEWIIHFCWDILKIST